MLVELLVQPMVSETVAAQRLLARLFPLTAGLVGMMITAAAEVVKHRLAVFPKTPLSQTREIWLAAPDGINLIDRILFTPKGPVDNTQTSTVRGMALGRLKKAAAGALLLMAPAALKLALLEGIVSGAAAAAAVLEARQAQAVLVHLAEPGGRPQRLEPQHQELSRAAAGARL